MSAVIELGVVYFGIAIFALFLVRTSKRRAGTRLDFAYLLLSPALLGTATRGAMFGVVGVIALGLRGQPDIAGVLSAIASLSPLSRLPLLVQLVIALVVGDFLGYASHRLRHTRTLFRLHAIHHSSETLDWLSAPRMHPLDELIDGLFIGVPLLLIGLDPLAVGATAGIVFLQTLVVHADLDTDFGPLRRVLVSPRTHRLHHARGRACNYAAVFSFIDVLFGTFACETSCDHGLETPIEESLGAHLVAPFYTRSREGKRSQES